MNADDPEIDRLLAEHLRQQAERIDVSALRARLRQSMAIVPPAPVSPARPHSRWRRLVAIAAGSAAMFVLATVAFFAGESQPLRASPRALLQEAQKAHQLPLDRCYLVEIVRADENSDELPAIAGALRSNRLWTRGDRFCIESNAPKSRWAWGRDENGTVWVALGPRRGIRIEPEEASRMLQLQCDVSELRPEHLLGDILRDFDLVREDNTNGEATVQIVRAERKDGRRFPPLRTAILELDTETKVLRRVELTRQFPDRTVTTKYTLIETQNLADDRYRLEGHLTAPFEIYTSENQPFRRREALSMVFGPRGPEWLRPFLKEAPK